MTELPKPDVSGICPHCGYKVVFIQPTLYEGRHESEEKLEYFYTGHDGIYKLIGSKCPNSDCKRFILVRQMYINHNPGVSQLGYASGSLPSPEPKWEDDIMIWPRGIARPIPKGSSPEIERDFKEACGTLYISKRASAALSRRCLQNLLREKEGVHKNTLYEEIEDVLNANTLPSPLQTTLHMIRNLGTIAAHPLKDKVTGNIFDVEEEEAEHMIDSLTDLLDYYDRLQKYGTTAKAAGQKVASQKKPPKKK